VYFELSSFEKALEKLSQITPEFYDFPKVLLARGWCHYKQRNYQKTITNLNDLTNEYADDQSFEEIHFLLGQCYLKLNYFSFAVNEFQAIIDKTPSVREFPKIIEKSSDELTIDKENIQSMQNKANAIEAQLVGTIRVLDSGAQSAVRKERERLQRRRDLLLDELISEREDVTALETRMHQLQKMLDKIELQKRWRAYAEYGKVRAMYLQLIPEK